MACCFGILVLRGSAQAGRPRDVGGVDRRKDADDVVPGMSMECIAVRGCPARPICSLEIEAATTFSTNLSTNLSILESRHRQFSGYTQRATGPSPAGTPSIPSAW
jgi:hypothetical protein